MTKIINDLKSREFKCSKRYLIGFSAGAQFSSRFSLIHPEMTAACALNDNGARVWPETNDGVKYFIAVGNQDSTFRIENAEIFYKAAKQLNIPVEYKQYKKYHSYSSEQI